MMIQRITGENRELVNELIRTHWFSTEMVVRGEVVDMTGLDGFVMADQSRIVGLITYRLLDRVCEIMSLDSFQENQGIGTALVNQVVEAARKIGCRKINLITTNDNLRAMGFYQKRGFDLVKLYPNALEVARKLKPSIPLLGEGGIPLKHEIEFELELDR